MPDTQEIKEVIKQLSSLTKEERKIILDLPDHFRRIVLHLGTLSVLQALVRKSIQQFRWENRDKIAQLLERLQKEVDPEKGIITGFVYSYTSFAPLQQLEKQKLEEEEKITFHFYDILATLLEKFPHHPKTAAKLKKIEERLIQAKRKEKVVIALSVHLDSLLAAFRQTIGLWQRKLQEERALLNTIREQLVGPFISTQLPLLRECSNKLQEHLRYGRQLQVRLHEEFYKPFRTFLEEKFTVEDRLNTILEARRHWYSPWRKLQVTRQDFVLDYYTLTSPEDVLEYILALEALGTEYIAPDLQRFLRRNKKRLLERVRTQKATLVQKLIALGKDPLTGIYTRGTIEQRLTELIELGKRNGLPFSLLLLDIDFFKSINDTYGHLAGDAVLRRITNAFQEVLRKYDLLGRYGGEEFIILLPHTGKEQAVAVAEKVRENVMRRNQEPVNPITKGPLTVSIGVATFPQDGSAPRQLIESADKALYQAKGRGRNQVMAA